MDTNDAINEIAYLARFTSTYKDRKAVRRKFNDSLRMCTLRADVPHPASQGRPPQIRIQKLQTRIIGALQLLVDHKWNVAEATASIAGVIAAITGRGIDELAYFPYDQFRTTLDYLLVGRLNIRETEREMRFGILMDLAGDPSIQEKYSLENPSADELAEAVKAEDQSGKNLADRSSGTGTESDSAGDDSRDDSDQ